MSLSWNYGLYYQTAAESVLGFVRGAASWREIPAKNRSGLWAGHYVVEWQAFQRCSGASVREGPWLYLTTARDEKMPAVGSWSPHLVKYLFTTSSILSSN